MTDAVLNIRQERPGERENGEGAGNVPVAAFSITDHLVMGLLIWSSGNPAFLSLLGSSQTTYVVLFILMALLTLNTIAARPAAVATFFKVWCCFLVLALVHFFSGTPLQTELGMLVRMGIAGLAAIRLYDKFAPLYLKWFLLLSKVSLFFWICSLCDWLRANSPLVVSLSRLGNHPYGYLLINTFHPLVYDRNCGIFWEPGAFAGYLILALIFLLIQTQRQEITGTKRHFFLLMLTLLSTMSTTGYVAVIFLCGFYIVKRFHRNVFWMLFLLALFIAAASFVFYNTDFLSGKIAKEFSAVDNSDRNWEMTRFGSILSDWHYIGQRPFLGWGSNYEAIGYDLELKAGMGNGLSDFILKNGILGILLWGWGCYRFFFRQSGTKLLAGSFLAVCLITLQGEIFLAYPLYLSLMFCGFIAAKPQSATELRY